MLYSLIQFCFAVLTSVCQFSVCSIPAGVASVLIFKSSSSSTNTAAADFLTSLPLKTDSLRAKPNCLIHTNSNDSWWRFETSFPWRPCHCYYLFFDDEILSYCAYVDEPSRPETLPIFSVLLQLFLHVNWASSIWVRRWFCKIRLKSLMHCVYWLELCDFLFFFLIETFMSGFVERKVWDVLANDNCEWGFLVVLCSTAQLVVGNPFWLDMQNWMEDVGVVNVFNRQIVGCSAACEPRKIELKSPSPMRQGRFGAAVVTVDLNQDGHDGMLRRRSCTT